jgi:hypothetical protein
MPRKYLKILIAGILVFLVLPIKAQVNISVGINIGSQPVWGPVGYDGVQYYYLPDIDVYYYVPGHLFYFRSGRRWASSPNLPPQYANYDLYGGYKVVLNENKPYLHDKDYRIKYASFKDRHDQPVIRDSHDSKYFVIKDHPEHNKYVKPQGHDNHPDKNQPQRDKQDHNNKHDTDRDDDNRR